MVAPELFRRFPKPEDLASASFEDVLAVIKSISYPNSKAAHLIGMAQKLLREYAGEVPSDIDQLMTLPGVGRKTANVLASVIYDKPVIAVDTHVSVYPTGWDCRTERQSRLSRRNWSRTSRRN